MKRIDRVLAYIASGAASMAFTVSFVSSVQQDYSKATYFILLAAVNVFFAIWCWNE